MSFDLLTAHVELTDAALEPLVRLAWGREVLPREPRFRLKVGLDPADLSGPTRTVDTSQGTLSLCEFPGGWTLESGRVQVRLEPGGAEVTLPLNPDSSEAVASHLALTEAGRASGLLPLHAAVLSRNGRAVAVSGASGTGKSTAALRLMAAGWSLVAEDSAWLDPVTRRVAGADQGIRVFESSLHRFAPEWLERASRLDIHGKRWFATERAAGAVLERLYVLGTLPVGILSGAAAVQTWWTITGLPVAAQARGAVSANLGLAVRQFPLESIDRDALVERLTSQAH
ncbi:hypothetical protein [Deinococcus ruber]|uniref:Golgi pH regulator conserved domain-containing protein n=1 Tax=Deinococcus ruber TaxID=1848197 RepID=A0A918BUH0_9DEIO|nr:hypothetical protein [Deinococcus ruber]GGQ93249.1 hypothetical protein GCM10008957_01550 [Deinococcus ruber]